MGERPGDFLEHRLEHQPGWHDLNSPDRRLAQEIIFGVTRWRKTLDWLIHRKSDNRPQRPELLVLLRIGLYQLFWLDRIPPHAAVDCSVTLAREMGLGPQSGFINAVLRGYVRQEPVTRQELEQLKISDPATGWSHPQWLVDRWRQRWPDTFADLLEWDNTPARTYARVNTLRTTPEKLLQEWREEGVEYAFLQPRRDWISDGQIFQLLSFPPLATLPSFQAGGFYIQDPSTLLAVRTLDPEPGESVLDLCAAPGGKTTLAAQIMNNTGRIVAYDSNPERLALVRENCTRLGVTCVDIHGHDPAGIQFDKVLVDAPCSNTGVLRRRIESRWRLTPEEIGSLRDTQLALLARAALATKRDGAIVYSTCSLEPEENTEVIERFLQKHPEFEREDQRELLPMRDLVDGAFVCRLSRR